MHGKDELYLVLPSNVAPKTYPTNRPNHFYTPLLQPLYFETFGWKVALKEITYQNSVQTIVDEYIEVWQDTFDTYDEVEKISFDAKQDGTYIGIERVEAPFTTFYMKEMGTDFAQKYRTDDLASRIEYDTTAGKSTSSSHPHGSMQGFRFKTALPSQGTKGSVTLLGKPKTRLVSIVRPSPGYYPTKQKLCEELNHMLESRQIAFSLVHEGEGNRIQLSRMPSTHRIILGNGLHYVMGFKDMELKKAPHTAVYKADLNRGNYAMFVYCDIVEPILVGDSLVPLLRTTHLTSSEHGAIVNQVFNPPLYMKIGKTLVNTIEVDIRTDTGEPFPLTADGKVILTLHVTFDPL